MGRTVWNPVLVSIAVAPSFAWELLEQIQQQLQHTPSLFVSLSLHLHVSIVLSSCILLPTVSFFICDISVFLFSHLMSVFFLFSLLLSFCHSPPLPQSPGIRTLRFYFCCCSIFHTVVCFTLLFISSIILFIFYLENNGRKMAALLPVGYYF